MKFKASLDRIVTIVTIAITILFIVLTVTNVFEILNAQGNISIILIHIGLTLLFAITFIAGWGYAPIGYSLDASSLIIHRRLGNKITPLNEIESVRAVSKEDMAGTIRVFGVGGFFGYFGRFSSSQFGKLSAFTSRWNNFVLIKLKDGKQLLLSPDDQLEMVTALEKTIK